MNVIINARVCPLIPQPVNRKELLSIKPHKAFRQASPRHAGEDPFAARINSLHTLIQNIEWHFSDRSRYCTHRQHFQRRHLQEMVKEQDHDHATKIPDTQVRYTRKRIAGLCNVARDHSATGQRTLTWFRVSRIAMNYAY